MYPHQRADGEARLMTVEPLLDVSDLRVTYRQRGWRKPTVVAVDGVSFTVNPGETVGLVGESGSGKSTIGRAILGLVDPAVGTIDVDGHRVGASGTAKAIASVLQVVFQDPYSSLNPSRTIGRTLTEPLEVQRQVSRADADAEVKRLLDSVSLPAGSAGRLPHSFSGGQRQRIGIARSLAVSPKLIICDEALSALDLVTQAHVLNLLRRLQSELGVAFLFIAHNLPVVAQLSHRVIVLYRGRIMEQGPAEDIHNAPLHPYTTALLAAVPVPDPVEQRRRRTSRAESLSSDTANAVEPPVDGCPFAPRCAHADDVCWKRIPTVTVVGERQLACHLFDPASGHPEALSSPQAVLSGFSSGSPQLQPVKIGLKASPPLIDRFAPSEESPSTADAPSQPIGDSTNA
jgi:oligopeptide/dipeptide ABC transporter ATP-binding protein